MNSKNISLIVLMIAVVLGCKEGHDHEGKHDDDLHNVTHKDHEEDSDEISKAQQIKVLKQGGFKIFEFVDEASGDTLIMQQYFMAFLKRGPKRDWTKEESDSIQGLHMDHLTRMYEEGYADISGPFGDDQDLRGITVYNVPTLQMADSLANLDPSVRAGNLAVEVRPWWAGKGYPLR